MTFNPDEALLKSRESVNGLYFDGSSKEERRIEHLERVVSALFRQERKLKLERLMYKADAKAWYHHDCHNHKRLDRWDRLYLACRNKLEELKK